MRWPRALLVIACAGSLAGCGGRHVVAKIDVLSYLDPALTQVEVGPVVAVPGGFYFGEQAFVKDQEVNLVEGTSSVAEVEAVSIRMTALAVDSTGSGADTLRLYISDVDVEPLITPPAVVLPISLVPGVTDTVSLDLGGDSRVADLFSQKHLRLTLTTSLRGPDSGPDLNARIRVLALDAVVVAGRKSGL